MCYSMNKKCIRQVTMRHNAYKSLSNKSMNLQDQLETYAKQ